MGVGIPFLIGLFCIPIYSINFSPEIQKVIFELIALLSIFLLFDFGIAKSSIHLISKKVGIGNLNEAKIASLETFSMSLMLAIVVGFISFFVISNLSGLLFNRNFAFLISLAIFASILISSIRSIFEGFGDFKKSNLIRGLAISFIYISPTLPIIFKGFPILDLILLSSSFTRLLVVLFGVFLLFRKDLIIKNFSLKYNFALLKNSVIISFSSIFIAFMLYMDRYFISHYLSIDESVTYMKIQEVVIRFLVISGSFSAALYHQLSKKLGEKTQREIIQIYLSNSKKIYLLLALCMLVLLFLYSFNDFVDFFPSFFSVNYDLIIIMLTGVIFLSFSTISQTVLYSIGEIKVLLKFHLFQLTLFFVFMELTYDKGLIAVGTLWMSRAIIDFVGNEIILRRKQFSG